MTDPQLSIISPWNDGTRWIYSTRNGTYQLDASGNRIKQEEFTFTGFPPVSAYVLADNWAYADRLFAIKSFPATNEDSTVVFDQRDLSTIQIALIDANTSKLREFSVQIFAFMNGEKIFVTGLTVPSQSKPFPGVIPWEKRLEDGQVKVPNLGAGKYVVTISNAHWTHPSMWERQKATAPKEAENHLWEHSHEIDLEERTDLHLQFQVNAEGRLMDTKVTTTREKENQ